MDLPIVAPRKRSVGLLYHGPRQKTRSRKAAYLKKNDRLARTAVPKSWSQKIDRWQQVTRLWVLYQSLTTKIGTNLVGCNLFLFFPFL
ncbi:hypothetical protein MJO28_013342 [Puccinia striiformis f. sp. tritici]|uniref:Uncharacterized protein n=1 Tax=Puccinia striiformis f. sp. tritici TaxID=168172 RepID=A0ACC0DY19_9BASI|nr:hypothetical protein MJO28_013342 [Puccinia striiformis f. sp. tritici]